MSSVAKILRINQLLDRTGDSRSSAYEKMNPKSPRFDPDFPQPVKIGMRAKGWFDTEVDAYVLSRPRARNIGGAA